MVVLGPLKSLTPGTSGVPEKLAIIGYPDAVTFARHLVKDIGLAAVPGSSFFPTPAEGAHLIRFAFPKKRSTLERAVAKLREIQRLDKVSPA